MSPVEETTNWEVFLWGLSLLNGDAEFVDVEDVFIRCFELAPKRFSWRTRPIPDYKKCSKALRDAEARTPELLVKTRDGLRRRLTVEGQQWVSSTQHRMSAVASGAQKVKEPRSRPQSRLLADVERSDLFREWSTTRAVVAEKWRFAELLRCAPDSSYQIWRDRLQVLRSAAHHAENNNVLEFLNDLGRDHPSWFEDTGP
jgi:hypothetical protein